MRPRGRRKMANRAVKIHNDRFAQQLHRNCKMLWILTLQMCARIIASCRMHSNCLFGEIIMPWIRSLGIAFLFVPLALAADWPQWLGPKRDGSSPEKVAPWQDPLKILWRHPVGEGHSAPIMAAGQIFLHTKVAGKLH